MAAAINTAMYAAEGNTTACSAGATYVHIGETALPIITGKETRW